MKIGDYIVARAPKMIALDYGVQFLHGVILEEVAPPAPPLADRFRVLWCDGKITLPSASFLKFFRVVQSSS